MADYNPPKLNNLPFKFTQGGYVPPAFGSVPFEYTQPAALGAAINVLQLYQNEAYTYEKECKTIIIGYSVSGVQTIKLSCTFGGIRDIGAFINPQPPNKDLSAQLNAVANYLDLIGFLKIVNSDNKDINAFTRTFSQASYDLSGNIYGDYVKKNLIARLNVLNVFGLGATLSPILFKGSSNIYGFLRSFHSNSNDLAAALNIIEISNFNAYLNGTFYHSAADISSHLQVFSRGTKDFNITLHGWDTKDLWATIDQVYSSDLSARILSTINFDLKGFLRVVPSIALRGLLHGFDVYDLYAKIVGGYGPTDLLASVFSIAPSDLTATINGYFGINKTKDLNARISSYFTSNLAASILPGNIKDLSGVLNSRGFVVNLKARLVPKIIHIKRRFDVSLLSSSDLSAVINTTCLSTGYTTLGAYLRMAPSKNLGAYIQVGNALGGNLPATINASETLVENKLGITFFNKNEAAVFTLENHDASSGITLDTIIVNYAARTTSQYSSLKAYLVATKFTKGPEVDFGATVLCTSNPSYVQTSFGTYNALRPTVYKLNYNSRLDWRREVEIIFNSYAKHYTYVAGTNKAYRENKDSHWIINVEGFNYVPGIGIDKGKVRHRYIFDLRKYKTIDEAIRDAIERVSTFKQATLRATLNGVVSLRPFREFSGYIFARGAFSGFNDLKVLCKGVVKAESNFSATVLGEYPKKDFWAAITGVYYNAPKGDSLYFDFEADDLITSIVKTVDFNFKIGT